MCCKTHKSSSLQNSSLKFSSQSFIFSWVGVGGCVDVTGRDSSKPRKAGLKKRFPVFISLWPPALTSAICVCILQATFNISHSQHSSRKVRCRAELNMITKRLCVLKQNFLGGVLWGPNDCDYQVDFWLVMTTIKIEILLTFWMCQLSHLLWIVFLFIK